MAVTWDFSAHAELAIASGNYLITDFKTEGYGSSWCQMCLAAVALAPVAIGKTQLWKPPELPGHPPCAFPQAAGVLRGLGGRLVRRLCAQSVQGACRLRRLITREDWAIRVVRDAC